MNRTKIIATVGPACANKKMLQKLIDRGVVCFRINLSHGSDEEKAIYFDLIKSLKTPSGLRPTILADLAGPKIRVKNLENPILITKGDKIELSNEKKGDKTIPVSSGVRFQKVNSGAKILIDDGRVSLKVVEHITDQTLACEALEDGVIENRKGVNFPEIALDVPVLTEQDEKDLLLSLEKEADWIALSFVRSPSDYSLISSKIKEAGHKTPVMAKIEKWEAVQNLDAIIESFDAVMVARGDLGVELPIAKVPLVQMDVIEKAHQVGKPVVVATQILDSMTERPVPTRAEVSDIANSILDGADALMVTGETAIGKHPKKVIKVLQGVIKETESAINYQNNIEMSASETINTAKAISQAACSVARHQSIKTLVTMTHSGSTARMAARYRPAARIVAMTPFKKICRQLAIVWGVSPILVDEYESADEIPTIANRVLKEKGFIEVDEKFVITGGVPVGVPGTTNYLSVLKLS
tara:strand:- start:328 stop:1734 length:1407 start_codon:yes stop_codon:yes gene_type:complete